MGTVTGNSMDVERIETLHQKASEHYLSGEYSDAARVWRELLTLDPANEQALEGVRMCDLLAGQDSATAEEAAGVESPLSAPPAHDPSRQSEGIDFGDLAALEAIPVATGIPPEPDPAREFTDAPAIEEPESFGLAPVERTQVRHPSRPSAPPADAELRNRIRDLLDEARAKGDAGNVDEALAVLSRVFILDEENADARALEGELRARAESGVADIETWLVEGIQAYENGQLDEARRWFGNVLERMPGHREALHYVEKIESAAAPQEDLLATQAGEADTASGGGTASLGHLDLPDDPSLDSIPLSLPPVMPQLPRGAPARPVRTTAPSGSKSGRAGISLPSMKTLMTGAAVAAAIGGAYIAYTMMSPSTPPDGSAAPSRPTAAATTAPSKTPPPEAPKAGAPVPRPALSFPDAMNRGRRAMESKDFAAAIVAYNQAVQIDPTHEEARQGMEAASEAYKAKKAEDEQIQRIRDYFEENEYASALRVLYRLPDSIDAAKVSRWKVNGWYNKGVAELLGAECREAKESFDEALALDAGDEGVKRLAEFAAKAQDVPKDRAYYSKVESIGFRKLDD